MGTKHKVGIRSLNASTFGATCGFGLLDTPTAQLADYVLPAASWLERPLCTTVEDWFPLAIGGERAIELLGERHEDYQFLEALGDKARTEGVLAMGEFGRSNKVPHSTLGIKLRGVCRTGWLVSASSISKIPKIKVFRHSRVRWNYISTLMERLGYDPLPYYEEPPEKPHKDPGAG